MNEYIWRNPAAEAECTFSESNWTHQVFGLVLSPCLSAGLQKNWFSTNLDKGCSTGQGRTIQFWSRSESRCGYTNITLKLKSQRWHCDIGGIALQGGPCSFLCFWTTSILWFEMKFWRHGSAVDSTVLSVWSFHVLPMSAWVSPGRSGFPHHQKHVD